MSIDFKTSFEIDFERRWQLRNILVNHLVYWRGERIKLDPKNIHNFKHYLAVHTGGGDINHLEGVMYNYPEIFISEIDSDHPEYGFLNPINAGTVIDMVEKEYRLKQEIEKEYLILDFLWDVYHARNHKKSGLEMIQVFSKLLSKAFDENFPVVELPKGNKHARKYLHINWEQNNKGFHCYIAFETGNATRQDGDVAETLPYMIRRHVDSEKTKGSTVYPLLCALDFSSTIIDFANSEKVHLIQVISLLRFISKVIASKKASVVLANLKELFEDNGNPLSAESALKRILEI